MLLRPHLASKHKLAKWVRFVPYITNNIGGTTEERSAYLPEMRIGVRPKNADCSVANFWHLGLSPTNRKNPYQNPIRIRSSCCCCCRVATTSPSHCHRVATTSPSHCHRVATTSPSTSPSHQLPPLLVSAATPDHIPLTTAKQVMQQYADWTEKQRADKLADWWRTRVFKTYGDDRWYKILIGVGHCDEEVIELGNEVLRKIIKEKAGREATEAPPAGAKISKRTFEAGYHHQLALPQVCAATPDHHHHHIAIASWRPRRQHVVSHSHRGAATSHSPTAAATQPRRHPVAVARQPDRHHLDLARRSAPLRQTRLPPRTRTPASHPIATAWQPHHHPIATAWQPRRHPIATAWQPHRHPIATVWQPHRTPIATAWQPHRIPIATAWQPHRHPIATAWQPLGLCRDARPPPPPPAAQAMHGMPLSAVVPRGKTVRNQAAQWRQFANKISKEKKPLVMNS